MEQIIVFTGKYLFVVVPFIVLILFFTLPRHQKIKFLLVSFLSLPLSLATAKILNQLILNPRPFVVEKVQPLIPHAPDNGFPSDHTLLVATLAAIVFVQNKKVGSLLMVISIIIGGARILAKIHSPVDIAGSIVIAVVVTYLSSLLVRRASFKFQI